jgi:hypothetical protein
MTLWYLLLFGLVLFAIFRMWRHRGGVYVRTEDAAFDRTEGHPDTALGLEHVLSGNWTALTSLYWNQPPSDRYHFVQGIGELAKHESVTWPDGADSAVLTIQAGVCLAKCSTAIEDVITRRAPKSRAAGISAILAEAKQLLVESARRNPHDSANLALQLRVEAGKDRATFNNLLGRIDATGEANIFAALNHIMFVSPRARGSMEELWETANGYASNPHNAAWLAIAAFAHIEEWRHSMNSDAALRRAYISRMQDPGFTDHIRSLDRLFWNRAEESEMSRAEATFAHNNFAFLLQMVRADDALAPHLDRIGRSISALPWCYLPDGALKPTRLISDLRRKAGLSELATI